MVTLATMEAKITVGTFVTFVTEVCTVTRKSLVTLVTIPATVQRYRQQWRTQEFCSGGSTNSVEERGQRERGSGDGSPLVRGSEDSCNFVQEISFRIVKFS